MNEELSHLFPFEPNEDLHFVCSGQPLRSGRFPFGEAIAASLAVPWERFIVNKLAFTIPECRPLGARSHLIV